MDVGGGASKSSNFYKQHRLCRYQGESMNYQEVDSYDSPGGWSGDLAVRCKAEDKVLVGSPSTGSLGDPESFPEVPFG